MATYQHFQEYHEQPLFINPNTFVYGQYDSRRSKTPTESLVNHTGLSPGPLITTPPSSRRPSHPRDFSEDQLPEQMLWDNGSLSNSPTSVMTPDIDSIDVEMLDSEARNVYHHSGVDMSIHGPHDGVPAMGPGAFVAPQDMISDQTLQAALNATMTAGPQGYNMYEQQSRQLLAAHHYNYNNQSIQHDPWNGQGPFRSSIVPRSGHVVFDPEHYSGVLVDSWRSDYTDPSYLISPSEPTVPPQDNFYFPTSQTFAPQSHGHVLHPQVQDRRPIEMHVTRASPPPDNQNFVNYDASSRLFTENYTTGSQYPVPSSLTSSAGHISGLPYEGNISPSAASPISSDGMISSYQASEPGMMIEPYPAYSFSQVGHVPVSAMDANLVLPGSVPEMTFDASPGPDSAGSAAAKALAKSGGRALGTHLEPTVAKQAHDMRKIVACWHCVLQRDKCGPGDICERCLKRSQRPNADCGLGCCRIKLVDLSVYFLPALITQMHEDSNLTHFVTQYIHQWGNVELTVMMTCGQKTMPRIPVKVYEFSPRGNALLVQIQYKTDPVTHQRIAVEKKSPALGMVQINHNEEKKYDQYITDIVDHHLDDFGELCWKEDDNDFQQKLFKLMTRVKPKSDDEAKLLREIYRLVVVTYIMSHTLTIAEETKVATLSRMHSYGGHNSYVDNYTSPRMTNRQLKYFFSRLQRSIKTNVLNKLQQIFKSSKGCDKWMAAFVAVLGMCMALEDQQKTIHLVMATKSSTEGIDQRDAQGQADIACREIDSRMHFVQQIFRWKYNRKCNPMRDADHAWDKEVGFGDASSVNFVRQVAQLAKDNIDYLSKRQQVSISPANQTKYTSRLVAQFLLSFWLPNA